MLPCSKTSRKSNAAWQLAKPVLVSSKLDDIVPYKDVTQLLPVLVQMEAEAVVVEALVAVVVALALHQAMVVVVAMVLLLLPMVVAVTAMDVSFMLPMGVSPSAAAPELQLPACCPVLVWSKSSVLKYFVGLYLGGSLYPCGIQNQ